MRSRQRSAAGPDAPWLSAEELVIHYRGNGRRSPGLAGFTADFGPGITGLIGPNGAGKTTFLRAAAGLLLPTSGRIEVSGGLPGKLVASGGIGFLPENPPLPPYLTVHEFLTGLIPESTSQKEGNPTPSRHGALSDLRNKRLDSLSLGQRKKVALSAALLGDPTLLLLDEPTNGLDPMAVRELRETLLTERSRGTTMILSSHHLDELQRLADGLVFVKEGAVVGMWGREEAIRTFGTLEGLFDQVFLRRGQEQESVMSPERGVR